MTRYIQRHPLIARIVHGTTAISCVLLAISGLFVFVPQLTSLVDASVMHGIRMSHRVLAVIFVGGPLIELIFKPSQIAHIFKNIFAKWDKDDVEFTKKFVPYLFAPQKVHMPDQHETKSGQRLADGAMVFSAIFIAISGFVLWFGPGHLSGTAIQVALVVHDICFFLIAILGLAHIYLGAGIFQPYRGIRRLMFGDGKVSESDALYHWGHWAREELKSGENVSEEK